MKIVFTSTGTGWDDKLDPRFGRADYLLVLDDTTNELTVVDNREIRMVEHGAGPKTAQKLYDIAPNVLITGNGPGGNALTLLNRLNLEIYVGASGTIREVYEAYKNNQLTKGGK